MSMQLTDSRSYLPSSSNNVNVKRINLWSRRTRLEKVLLVATCCATFIILALIIAVVAITSLRKIEIESNNVCLTDECKQSAISLAKDMNFDINPCDDFYSFVCGNFKRNAEIVGHRTTVTKYSILRDENTNKLKEIVMKKDGTINHSKSLKKALNYFEACNNLGKRNELKYKLILDTLKPFKGWPLLNRQWNEVDYSWTHAITEFNNKFADTSILINYFVHIDNPNKTQSIIYIDQPSFGADVTLLKNSETAPERLDAYKKLIKDLATFLGSNLSSEEMNNEIEEIIEFETRLAKHYVTDNVNYHKISLNELKQKHKIDWVYILNENFKKVNVDVNEKQMVFIRNSNYFESLNTILSETNTRTIANYISWRIVELLAPYSTENVRNAIIDFRRVDIGLKNAPSVSEECFLDASSVFKYAVGFTFINKVYDPETTNDIHNLIRLLKASLTINFQMSDWMDDSSKIAAQIKLNQMGQQIASPPWVNNTSAVEQFYEKIEDIEKDEYMENFIKINIWKRQRMLSQLKSPTDLDEWPNNLDIESATAIYTGRTNQIIIPAGILQPPFYDAKRPIYMNLGSIGSIIGHEITHGFDTKGSKFDANGNSVDWWTDNTKKTFKDKSKCFEDQYSQYKDPVTNKNVNGSVTLNENIADNGGLRQAYTAFKIFTSTNEQTQQRLPFSMEKFTSDQLFFISFANMWCIKNQESNSTVTKAQNVHSPPKWRVNGVLSNFEDFARVFKCPNNSRMNPSLKCQLW